LHNDALPTVKLESSSPAKVSFHVKGNTRIKRFRVDVETDASGLYPVRILNLMDGLQLVDGDNFSVVSAADRVQELQLYAVRSCETVDAYNILVLRGTASRVSILVSEEFALNHGHPPQLAIMGVNWSFLTGAPTDHHYLEPVVSVD
jgi:hypothetical protein